MSRVIYGSIIGFPLIGASGFSVARLAGADLGRALVHAAAVAAAGSLLIAVKALTH